MDYLYLDSCPRFSLLIQLPTRRSKLVSLHTKGREQKLPMYQVYQIRSNYQLVESKPSIPPKIL